MGTKEGLDLLLGSCILADILEQPQEDLHRLAYADWLTERAEPAIAELAGVRHELEGLDPRRCGGYYCDTYDDGTTSHRGCRYGRLIDREAELLPAAALADRAEFIRLQCEIATWRPCPNAPLHGPPARCPECERRNALRRRERELLDARRVALAGDFPNGTVSARGEWAECYGDSTPWHYVFSRGFVASVSAPLAALLEHLPALVRQHPLEEAWATDVSPSVREYGGGYERVAWHAGQFAPFPGVWDALCDGRGAEFPFAEYDGHGAARAALSRAVLSVIRPKARV